MQRVEVEPGVSIEAQDLGRGAAVVFIPGFSFDHRVWDRQVRKLVVDHRVVCIDQRGHGNSDKPLDGYDVPRLSADAEGALDALEVEHAMLVGWSFGAQVAFHLAAHRPDLVARLVLVGSNAVRASRSDEFPFGLASGQVLPALIEEEERNPLASRRAMLSSAFAADPPAELLEYLLRISLDMPSWAAVACLESMLRTDLLELVDRVRMPVLQLLGADDPMHSMRGARWVNERLADAELVELEGCGHYPSFEAGDAFDDALAKWAAGVSGG